MTTEPTPQRVGASGLTAEPFRARPRPPEQLTALFGGGWPPFIDADVTAAACLPRIRELFTDLELILSADADGTLVAGCWGVPIRWDGDPAALPAGYSDSLVRALADHDAGADCDTLVIGAAQVRPDRHGAGVAGVALRALSDAARRRGLRRVVAPLRLPGKMRYPLTPIDTYAAWTRPDGTALDPWLRTHLAMGARVIGTSGTSQCFTGTVAEWERWSGMSLSDARSAILPLALAPLQLDHGRDHGELCEPAVWVRHPDLHP